MLCFRRLARLGISIALGIVLVVTLASAALARNWPAPIQSLADQGFTIIKRFDAPGGLQGYAARDGAAPIALYLTADGQHVLVGSLFDARGHNLSRTALAAAIKGADSSAVSSALHDAAWIADGAPAAPRTVYMFTDPNCPYCHEFYDLARPWVNAGKVQIRHIMVGILKPSSPAKAAALLGAADPSAALARHEHDYRRGGISPRRPVQAGLRARINDNYQLMIRFGLRNTPAFVYENADGGIETLQGLPSGARLEQLLGPR